MSKTVAILAVTGAQQSTIANRFAKAGWQIRGTTRRAAVGARYPLVVADPDTGEGLEVALAGADVAILTLPQDHRLGAMPRISSNVATAAARVGVGRLVLNTAATIDEAGHGDLSTDLRAARDAVRGGTVPWTILQPTVFMDNLLAPWSLPAIAEHGVLAYPAPEGARISWLSHRSLADFIYAAAIAPAAEGRDIRIGGPDALTGAELCRQLGTRLGRTITYQRIPLAAFAAGLDQAFGPPAGQRIASLYARLDAEPDAMAVNLASYAILDVKPETFTAFAARHRWSPSIAEA